MSKTHNRQDEGKRRSQSVLGTSRDQRMEPHKAITFQADGAGNSTLGGLCDTEADPISFPGREAIPQTRSEAVRHDRAPDGGQSVPKVPQGRTLNATPQLNTVRISRQFVPTERPISVVEIPQIKHPRIELEMKSSSPLYTGGSTLEGEVTVTVDGGKFGRRFKDLPPLSISRMTVNLVGVETWNGKHNIFQSIAVEVIGKETPPPGPVLAAATPTQGFWSILPSLTNIPFQFDLPVKIGPPPYFSKYASIRYILCATAMIRILNRDYYVRDSCDIAILTVNNRG